MIDFHNHILPNVDDGSKTIDESISMLEYAANQGITDVVNTVHFQHPKMDKKNTEYSFLKDQLEKLQLELDKREINIKLHLSAEVFYLPNLVDILDNKFLTIGNNKYMLIEFATNIFPIGYEKVLFELQLKGVTPIIAHPERYRFIQNNLEELQKWISKDYILQLDAGSVLGLFGKKNQEISYRIINDYGIHIIGSDAHNNKKRNFCLLDAYNCLEKIYTVNLVNQLKENAESLLLGKKIEIIQAQKNKQKNSLLDIIKGKFR